MNRLRGLARQLRVLFRKEAVEAALDEEIAFHIERETELNIAKGMAPAEARRAALMAFRGVDRYKEEVRDARWTGVLEDTASDVRRASRALRKRPGFAAAAILTLALGIGGTTAVYSVVRSVLFEPLPYPQSDRLVRLYQFDVDEPSDDLYVSGVHFREYRDHASFLESIATLYTYDETGADLTAGDVPERVRTLRVSPGYFHVLGARPVAGRAFTPDEEQGQRVAVIAESVRRRLGDVGEPGGAIELDGVTHTVVGVMPAGWRDPIVGHVDVWLPEDLSTEGAQFPGNHYLSMIGRLASGVTLDRARDEAAALDRLLGEAYPDVADDGGFRIRPLRDDLVAAARPTLLVLLGATALVLLIACVNFANLQMVRWLGGTREMAVRSALGARRARLARHVMAESLLIAAAGGLAGVAVARVGLDALLTVGAGAVPRATEVGLDGAVLLVAAVITVASGFVFGLVPALRLARTPPADALRHAARGATGSRRFARVRSALVAGQVALALVLLVGATALAASMYRLVRVDLGFRTANVLTFELNLPGVRYDSLARAWLHEEVIGRIATLPGVQSAAAVSWPPAGGAAYQWGTHTHTGPLASGEEGQSANVPGRQRVVAGSYFRTLGIPLVDGRVFDDRDAPDGTPVAVVSRSLGERLFPGTSPLGHLIHMGGVERAIVGVVEDVAEDAEGASGPTVYHSQRQYANRNWKMTYLVATQEAPLGVLPAVRRTVAHVDTRLVVHEPGTLDAMVGDARGRRSFAFVLMGVFAALALALAVIGVYGMLAYMVGQRTREIGIRIALGARRGEVARDVVRQGLVLTGAGLVVGLVGAVAAGRVLESLVFEARPVDPVVLAAAAVVLTVAAAAATLLPAIRAARVTPMTVLAEE